MWSVGMRERKKKRQLFTYENRMSISFDMDNLIFVMIIYIGAHIIDATYCILRRNTIKFKISICGWRRTGR